MCRNYSVLHICKTQVLEMQDMRAAPAPPNQLPDFVCCESEFELTFWIFFSSLFCLILTPFQMSGQTRPTLKNHGRLIHIFILHPIVCY